MSVFEAVFSPTGGTKKVSGIFMESFCQERIYIDLSECNKDFSLFTFRKEDICIISVPSFGGRVPAIVVPRLRQLKGNGARAVLIVVYGNRAYEDTLAELQDILESCGFNCIAAAAAVAEHSIMRQFAVGRPDAQDAREISSFAKNIRSELETDLLPVSLRLPGNRPYRAYGVIPMSPKAGKACIRCGLCAKACPAGAIPADDPAKTDTRKCISCMRCIAACPQKARDVSKALLTAAGMKLKKACSVRKENEFFL